MKRSYLFATSFILKIIAIISMTFDHIGVITLNFYPSANTFYTVCRYLGRFALPLFCFMIAEGMIHTHNEKKYIARLGSMALIISIILAIFEYVTSLGMKSISTQGNIFLDLLLGALMLWSIKQKNRWMHLLALLPIAISILSFSVKGIEQNSYSTIECMWYPYFLRLQYDWLSVISILGFYASTKLVKCYYSYQSTYSGVSPEEIEGTNQWIFAKNIVCFAVILFANIFYYLFKYIAPTIIFWDPKIQLFAIASGLVILFYNDKRGYDSKWFRIFSYLYYPIHIVVIYGIIYLIYFIGGGH